MFIAVLTLDVSLPGCASLKEKRQRMGGHSRALRTPSSRGSVRERPARSARSERVDFRGDRERAAEGGVAVQRDRRQAAAHGGRPGAESLTRNALDERLAHEGSLILHCIKISQQATFMGIDGAERCELAACGTKPAYCFSCRSLFFQGFYNCWRGYRIVLGNEARSSVLSHECTESPINASEGRATTLPSEQRRQRLNDSRRYTDVSWRAPPDPLRGVFFIFPELGRTYRQRQCDLCRSVVFTCA